MALLEHAPGLDENAAMRLARDLYGVRATATPLPSERDQNYLLETGAGERFVLKIANALEDRALLEAQNQAMAHLADRHVPCPRVVPTKAGDAIAETGAPAGLGLLQSPSTLAEEWSIPDAERHVATLLASGDAHSADFATPVPAGKTHLVRLVTYVPGIPLAEQRWHSPELLYSLGERLGQMDRAFVGFDHPAAHRHFHWDLANALQVVREYGYLIADAGQRALIQGFAADFERDVAPTLPGLPQGVIHNDANDYNVIVGGGDDQYTRNQHVAGIVDFGDMVYSYTVCDLAVAIAYAILDKPDPLAAAVLLVEGYHAQRPLADPEIAALWGFVCMRLCASACIAAYQRQQRPDDPYLTISQQPIRNTLPKLAQIHPRFAEATFRHACGLPAVPRAESIAAWLERNAEAIAPVLDVDLRTVPCTVFDLGIGSALVAGDTRANAEPALTERLSAELEAAGVRVGVGRYDEARLLYTSPLFATGDAFLDERRTVHIGSYRSSRHLEAGGSRKF